MQSKLQTGLLADPISKKHDTGPAHPECPQRYDAIWTEWTQAQLDLLLATDRANFVAGERQRLDEELRVHDERHNPPSTPAVDAVPTLPTRRGPSGLI